MSNKKNHSRNLSESSVSIRISEDSLRNLSNSDISSAKCSNSSNEKQNNTSESGEVSEISQDRNEKTATEDVRVGAGSEGGDDPFSRQRSRRNNDDLSLCEDRSFHRQDVSVSRWAQDHLRGARIEYNVGDVIDIALGHKRITPRIPRKTQQGQTGKMPLNHSDSATEPNPSRARRRLKDSLDRRLDLPTLHVVGESKSFTARSARTAELNTASVYCPVDSVALSRTQSSPSPGDRGYLTDVTTGVYRGQGGCTMEEAGYKVDSLDFTAVERQTSVVSPTLSTWSDDNVLEPLTIEPRPLIKYQTHWSNLEPSLSVKQDSTIVPDSLEVSNLYSFDVTNRHSPLDFTQEPQEVNTEPLAPAISESITSDVSETSLIPIGPATELVHSLTCSRPMNAISRTDSSDSNGVSSELIANYDKFLQDKPSTKQLEKKISELELEETDLDR